MMRLPCLLGTLALCAACSPPAGPTPVPRPVPGADGGAPDLSRGDGADAGPPPRPDMAPPYTTPFPPPPPQLLAGSGVVLASPGIIPVFFPRDPLQGGVVTFLQGYVASTAWQVVAQYGVGPAAVAAPVVVKQSISPTLTDGDVRALVAALVQDGTLPGPGAGTVYALYFPDGETIIKGRETGCKDFTGYHDTAQLADGTRYAYAVLPRCDRSNLAPLTFISSHELAEAATDPQLTAHQQLGAPYGLWRFALQGAEIGDLCQDLSDAAADLSGVGQISRLWSNAAAAMGQDPCQPASAGPAFLSVPILSELLPVPINGVGQGVESVAVAPGKTVTVAVRLRSPDRPSPTWTVAVKEEPLPGPTGAPAAPVLSLSFVEAKGAQPASGSDGTTLHLQIAAAATAPAGYTTVRLTSTGPTASGGQTQVLWVAAVRIAP